MSQSKLQDLQHDLRSGNFAIYAQCFEFLTPLFLSKSLKSEFRLTLISFPLLSVAPWITLHRWLTTNFAFFNETSPAAKNWVVVWVPMVIIYGIEIMAEAFREVVPVVFMKSPSSSTLRGGVGMRSRVIWLLVMVFTNCAFGVAIYIIQDGDFPETYSICFACMALQALSATCYSIAMLKHQIFVSSMFLGFRAVPSHPVTSKFGVFYRGPQWQGDCDEAYAKVYSSIGQFRDIPV